jgi:hypothetical protein
MKIMIAYDGSRNAKAGPAQTVEPVSLQCSHTDPDRGGGEPGDCHRCQRGAIPAGLRGDEGRALMEGADFAGGRLRCRLILAEGDARKMLLQATKKHEPDLLVIARHSKNPTAASLPSR